LGRSATAKKKKVSWLGHAVAQLVDALRYKSQGRGFDSPIVIEIFH